MKKVTKEDIILADCEPEELEDLRNGLNTTLGTDFIIKTRLANGGHSRFNNLYRYFVYALFPIKFFLMRRRYRYIICWQQFYALFFCQLCRIFKVKKDSLIIALNYTYKPKSFLNKAYYHFFRKNSESEYMHLIHVLSYNYAEKCSSLFNIREKIIVTPFGLADSYQKWEGSAVEYNNYCFSIGRSNRDYDFLVEAWKKMPKDELLVVASDTYKPKTVLPANVIHRTDILGIDQFPYIFNCKIMIIPIDDGTICSGDTVLLKAMSYGKPVVVTSPSTLGEMYIENNNSGLLLEKDNSEFANTIRNLLSNPERMKVLGDNAREKYKKNYSRYHMGYSLGVLIKQQK